MSGANHSMDFIEHLKSAVCKRLMFCNLTLLLALAPLVLNITYPIFSVEISTNMLYSIGLSLTAFLVLLSKYCLADDNVCHGVLQVQDSATTCCVGGRLTLSVCDGWPICNGPVRLDVLSQVWTKIDSIRPLSLRPKSHAPPFCMQAIATIAR